MNVSSISPGALSGVKKTNENPLMRIIKKVTSAVGSLFKMIFRLFSPEKFDSLFMKKMLGKPKKKNNGAENNPLVPGGQVANSPAETTTVPQPLPPQKLQNPTMETFRQTGAQFVSNAAEVVFDEKIGPNVPDLTPYFENSETIKSLVETFIKMGNKASKPFFERLKKYKVEEVITPDLKKMLNWLLNNSDPDKEKLKAFLRKEGIHEPIIDPALQWVGSDHSQPLRNCFPAQTSPENIDKVFEKMIYFLIDQKVEIYNQKLKEKVSDLSGILKKNFVENGEKIGDKLMLRVVDLLQNTEYQNTFQESLHLIKNQSKAVIDAEHEANQFRTKAEAFINAAEKKLNKTKDEEEVLELSKNEGRENYLNRIREEAREKAFIRMAICHPNAEDPDAVLKEIPKKILELLLPKDGRSDSIDDLLAIIDIPQELKDLFEEGLEIYHEIFTPQTQTLVNSFVGKLHNLIKDELQKVVVNLARTEMEKNLTQVVDKLFQIFMFPKKVDEFMAYKVLPSIRELLVEEMMKNKLEEKYKNHLDQLPHDPEVKAALIAELAEGFENGESMALKEVDKLLLNQKEYFKKESHEKNPVFGDIVKNLVFELGELGGLAGILGTVFNSKIVQVMSDGTHEAKVSPDFLVGKSIAIINKHFGTKEALRKEFFEKEAEKTQDEIQAKLESEIQKTAGLAYRMLKDLVDQKAPWGTHWVGMKVIGESPSLLEDVIRRVYNKMLSNETMTTNLVIRMQEVVLKALVAADAKIHLASKNITQQG